MSLPPTDPHERMLYHVFTAARRVAYCERQGLIADNDDWIHHGLRTYRRSAQRAGLPQEDIDDATMRGCVVGWNDS